MKLRVGLLVCLAWSLLFNGPGAHDTASADELAQYRLGIGDKIAIAVLGQADLSGEFIIDAAGYVQMPLVGPLRVATLTLDECQHAVADRLDRGLIKRPIVSVRINEFRPIYVTGDVQTPGAHAFRFGLRASAAIGLAGGFRRKESTAIADAAAFLTAMERVETASVARNAALIRLARIRAELANQKTMTVPQIEQGANNSYIAALIKNEQAELVSAVTANENAIDLMERQRPRLNAQMQSLKNEIAATEQQLASIRRYLERYEKLSEGGLGRRMTEFDLERQEAQQQAIVHRLRADISRLEVTQGDLDIRLEDLSRTRQTRLMNELRDTEAKILELNVALRSAQTMLKFRREQADAPRSANPSIQDYALTVTRSDPSRDPVPIVASKDTLLSPGDVLEVTYKVQPFEFNPKISSFGAEEDSSRAPAEKAKATSEAQEKTADNLVSPAKAATRPAPLPGRASR
jgi:polysaccharide biosynthesis/export protein